MKKLCFDLQLRRALPPLLPTRKLAEVGRIMNHPRVAACPGLGREEGGGRKVLGENFCEDRGESSFALDRSLEDTKLSAIEINNSWDLKTGERGG